jgi:hypothetical protein
VRGKSGNCVGLRFSVRADWASLKTNPRVFYPTFPPQPGPIFVPPWEAGGRAAISGNARFFYKIRGILENTSKTFTRWTQL